MKKSLLMFVLAALVAAPFSVLNGATAHAATVNTAIRGTSAETVYWYANDGKRYVFPNAAAYFTWFPSFDSVHTVSDAELISIPLGGNVTYRPGAKLVKINTDPRTYAVAKGGVLRHVTSESLASQLYGTNWRFDVHDIPDVYFTNYTVGTPIYAASDYNVSDEYHGVSTPGDSLRTTNGGTQTGDLVLNASRTSINPGESVMLTVGTMPVYTPGDTIEIFDARDNGLLCTAAWPNTICNSFTVHPQRKSTENSMQYYVVFTDSTTLAKKRGYSPVISFNGSTSNDLSIWTDKTSINSGDAITVSAWSSQSFSASRIDVRDERDNSLVFTCYDVRNCSQSRTFFRRNTSENTFRLYAQLKDWNGTVLRTAYTPTMTFNGTNQTGTLSLSADRTSITNGQAVVLTGTYSNTVSRLDIRRVDGDILERSCTNASTCSVTVYPVRPEGRLSVQYYVSAFDANGNRLAIKYGPVIYFDGHSSSVLLTIRPDRMWITSGEQVTLTTFVGGYEYQSGHVVDIYDARTNTLVASCGMTPSCVRTVLVNRNGGETSMRFEAVLRRNDGARVVNAYSSDIYINGSTGSSNDGVNYINGLVLNTDRTNINAGERVRLTANAFNSGTWSYVGNRIDIVDAHRGTIVKTCYDSSTCVADVYPQAQSSTNLTAQYQARIYDRNGVLAMTQYSPVIYLTSYAGGTNSALGTGLITFAPTDALKPNRNVYLTATFSGSNISQYDAQVRIYTEQSSSPIAVCNGSYNCSVSYPTGSTPMTTRIYAQLSNRYSVGTYAETPRVNLTTTW